ncbi:protein RIC-3b [Clupea harengus]|uniref:Protein RIC-3b n=1 Tax=Clupea harengus TaxID=7950 RepID=A0A6P3WDF5_CLUHA|nr:protein RIC-3b [Clupea harengus]
MSMSTFQKVTLVSCLVLCVALLLPKMLLSGGKKQQSEGGQFPPMARSQVAPEAQRGSGAQSSRSHNSEAVARAKGGGTGAGLGGKSGLAGQIIPIYGFGILLYILYILFKITSKGKTSKPPESRFSTIRSENMKRKISDFELAQLQDKLKETEEVMEEIVSKASDSPERTIKGVSTVQEVELLLQLKEITLMMNKGSLLEGITPERKTESSCSQHWEEPEYQEDTQPESEGGCCHHGHCHGYQHMADEWTERPEDGGMTDPLKEDEAERMGGVEDISPGFTEDGTHGMADADDMLRANMGDYHDCAVNGEEEREELMEDEEFNGDNEVLEIKQVRTDEDCSVWTSVHSEKNSTQLRKRNKK